MSREHFASTSSPPPTPSESSTPFLSTLATSGGNYPKQILLTCQSPNVHYRLLREGFHFVIISIKAEEGSYFFSLIRLVYKQKSGTSLRRRTRGFLKTVRAMNSHRKGHMCDYLLQDDRPHSKHSCKIDHQLMRGTHNCRPPSGERVRYHSINTVPLQKHLKIIHN
ncbi:unnamed protein product [Larinioides sclopetarius]|uniref:Uncharacterized protein n=1 Tax=Larinioides sclopetarius TaxID=280406 RepID=A0AAV2ASR3_9ARAC